MRGLTVPLTLLGIVMQFRALNHVDALPFVVMANAAALFLARAWPKGWWCTTRPARGLLVPLFLMTAGYLALHLAPNRPLPVSAWVGGALVVLACNASLLVGSRMRTGVRYTRQLAPDLSSGAAAEPMSGPRYTARVPEPFAGPGGWTEALFINVDAYADDDEEEDVDEDG